MNGRYRMKMGGEGGRRGPRGGGPRGGGGSGERGPNERGPGGRRRRLFDGGELRLMILSLLESQPRHGYDLIRALEQASGGAYVPSPGMVYPLLTMLSDMELVNEASDTTARKMLSLTPAGVAELDANRAPIAQLLGRLKALSDVRERTDAVPVRRAMHNLRAVLMARLSEDSVTRETILDAVALIDSAAQQIERL